MISGGMLDEPTSGRESVGRGELPMLVVTRRFGEGLTIGDQVEVIVVGVRRDRVRLGINAPLCVQVYRRELYEAMKGEREPATPPAMENVAPRVAQRHLGKTPRLVLTRRHDESIVIGDDVEVIVVGIQGKEVRLAVRHPPHIEVDRKEVFEGKQREKTPFAP